MSEVKAYRFGKTAVDGNASMKDVLGGKGANLAEMASIGIPVPPGFTIPCSASTSYKIAIESSNPNAFLKRVKTVLKDGYNHILEELKYTPLVSVRSGARVSMPGMMDTILNVGICDENLVFYSEELGERTALDCYRRLMQMYGSVVCDIPMAEFENMLSAAKSLAGVKVDSDLKAAHLDGLVTSYKGIFEKRGKVFPQDPEEQLYQATLAVFKSWDNQRAQEYRKINSIPEEWGTAVTVQAMVFGNKNDQSCTGVCFTRDPSSGLDSPVGEFLVNAQGEDVVAGIRTPQSMDKLGDWNGDIDLDLHGIMLTLENHYKDMQDIEFTVQDNQLYILQTRSGKRSAKAAFKIAYDLVKLQKITKEEALSRIKASDVFVTLKDTIDPKFKDKENFKGIAAGGGIVSGVVVTTAKAAIASKEPCILVTKETNPEDIAGMAASVGILTKTGGLTSHAAVVARGMNKVCVVGADAVYDSYVPSSGQKITICGETGRVWVEKKVPLIAGGLDAIVREVLSWGLPSDFSERIDTSLPAEQFEATVTGSKASVLYFDSAFLGASYAAWGNAMAKSKAEKFIIDCNPETNHWEASDSPMCAMFGVEATPNISVAEMALWSAEVKEKCFVILSKETPVAVRAKLQQRGFRVMGSIKNFQDLLQGDEYSDISERVINEIFGGQKAFDTAVQMVKQVNPKLGFAAPKPPVYWYEAISN